MVEAPPEGPGALPASGRRNGRTNGVGLAGAAIAAVVLAGALGLTWWRLFRGADLVHEAFSVGGPWRWALGDRPFVDEQNLVQTAGLLSYPFFKLYAVLGGNDVTGLVLCGRHVYLAVSVLAGAGRVRPGPAFFTVGSGLRSSARRSSPSSCSRRRSSPRTRSPPCR